MRDLGRHTAHLSTIVIGASTEDDTDVVWLSGHLDLNTAAKARETVLADPGLSQRRLVLELGGLELLDSSGIGTIVQLNRALRERGATLVLVTPSAHLRKLFRISALDTVLPIHDTLEDALRSDPDDFEPLTAG